jgi:GxxExxY protein
MGHEFEALSSKVIDVALTVHKELGPGFLESVYENAVKVGLQHRTISFEYQKIVPIYFEQEKVGVHRVDLIVERQLIIELKAVKELEDIYFAQLRSYLRATGLQVGLLMNFNAPRLLIKRVVN